jgi:hypothetical protein
VFRHCEASADAAAIYGVLVWIASGSALAMTG